MSNTTNSTVPKEETKLQTMSNGLTATKLTLLNSLVILGVSMSKADIITKLQAYILLFTQATQAKQAAAAAIASRKSAMADIVAFYDSLVNVIKETLGPSNAGQVTSFGISAPKERKGASPETKVIAKAKAAATRAARGTKGKQQALAITASPQPSVQVLGTPGQPLAATAPSTGTAAPSASSTPATPGSSGHTP